MFLNDQEKVLTAKSNDRGVALPNININVSLEQHRFEWHRSTCTQIILNMNKEQYYEPIFSSLLLS